MRLGFACLAVSALLVAAFWFWLGLPIAMPQTPLQPGEKLYCLSYAPFRGAQSPFDPAMHIPPEQIDDDMARLARITDCVRTYSVELGQDQVPAIAKRHGLKVIQGIWLGTNAEKNRAEIETAVRLANEFPDVIRALVVGNEVLLRGDLSADDLVASIRAVKARVKVPATYADVWEYWLRNAQVASAVDFVTIHILPYWEDFPIAAANAAAHVDAIRKRVAAAMAGKDVIIGEVGWPSEGRMREGALPSPANQARVIQDVLALASRENFRVNVIEAFDQPWKRALEGTVGGYWGLLDAGTRDYKFAWGQAVSNHPQWKLQAAGGVAFVIVIFASAFLVRRRGEMSAAIWLAVTANALAGGAMIGWCIADVPMQSFDAGGWLRNVALAAVAFLTPPVLSAATIRGTIHAAVLARDRTVSGARARSARACRGIVADCGDAAGAPVGARARVRSALPRFSLRTAHRRGGAVFDTSSDVEARGRRTRCSGICRRHAAGAVGASTLSSTKHSPIGNRCGSARALPRSRSFWRGRATGEAEDQQSRGKRGQRQHCKARYPST